MSQKMKSNEKAFARNLYLSTDWTLEAIAEASDVDERTIRNWIKADGWEALKEAKRLGIPGIRDSLYKQLQNLLTAIEANEKGYASSEQQNQLSKYIADITKLDDEITAPQYIEMTLEMAAFMELNYPDEARLFGPVLAHFLRNISKRLDSVYGA